jgi:5'-methylthioadenosine phosphorylase
LPEAKLAREAEIAYAMLATSTDYDCWHQSEEVVTVDAVVAVLHKNVDLAKNTLRELISRLPDPTLSPASRALENAIITQPTYVTGETRKLLAPLIKKYLPAE